MGSTAEVRMRQGEAAFLASYLHVLQEWDGRASVRMQQRDSIIGVYGSPPTECYSFVAIPLASAGDPDKSFGDRTVSVGRMRDCLGDVSTPARGVAGRPISIPEAITGAPSLAMLPPKSDWESVATSEVSQVAPIIESAIEEFKRRAPDNDPEAAQRLADEIWDRPGWSGVPIRALHTARSLGFLAKPEAPVQAMTRPGWFRLVTPSGQIFAQEGERQKPWELGGYLVFEVWACAGEVGVPALEVGAKVAIEDAGTDL